ncbi:hypothetical protein LCGC14_1633080 [marine sediment metagenome]|uniref:Uncharacterized protein n=1 Tax=marine sediment metagenome TaxID=412755 RepID=A0A0F9KHP2_9ZZZZ
MKVKTFKIDDLILPNLSLPDPCPVKIEIRDGSLFLQIGQRDWQWDFEDEKFVGCGTDLV